MTHVQIAPNVEFKMDIDLPGITDNPRDYDLQQYKAGWQSGAHGLYIFFL